MSKKKKFHRSMDYSICFRIPRAQHTRLSEAASAEGVPYSVLLRRAIDLVAPPCGTAFAEPLRKNMS